MLREFLLGFVRIHILYHASISPVYGSELIAELRTHGYRIGPGTLYPLLHEMEKSGYLEREDRLVDSRIRKYYSATDKGREALCEIRPKINELVSEVLEADDNAHGNDC